jgi:hypothetical protein
MKSQNFKAVLLAVLTITALGIQGCSNDAERANIPEEARLSGAELQTVMETEQWTGAVDETLAELFQNGNSATAKFADDSCYEATYSESGFTVVFGNCVLNQSENVNGTLVVTYAMDAQTPSFTATYSGFFVGEAALNGTRSFTLLNYGAEGFTLSVESEMTVELPDGSLLAESGTKTTTLEFGDTLEEIRFFIQGSWEVTVQNTVYTASVVSPLEGNLACAYLVSGQMAIGKNGLEVLVDFGDGTCDNTAMVVYPNGATEELEL